MGKLHSLKLTLWGEAAETPFERKYVRKIDLCILTFCCFSYFFNYLDRAALANAYVSGLREDLQLFGNDYNVILTCTNVGYILGMIPHALIIQKVAPSIWFPLMTLLWALMTMCCAAAQNRTHLCVIRFFLGMMEASTFSGAQYIMGSWYKKNELAKRLGLFSISGMAGTMFAGVMMSAIYSSMNGIAGLAGWRWVFIVDGIITIPAAVFGYFLLPDLPESTKAFYLTAEEKEFAISRLPEKDPEAHRVNFALIKNAVMSPTFWVFTCFWVVGGGFEAFCNQNCMLLWLRTTQRYTVHQNNTYPLGVTAIGIVSAFVTSIAIDVTGKHAPMAITACCLQIAAVTIILCWDHTGDMAKFTGFYVAGTAYIIQPTVWSWVSSILVRTGDDALRALTLYSMNAAASILFAIYGIAVFPASDAAGGFLKGSYTTLAMIVMVLIWTFLVYHIDKRTKAYTIDGESVAGTDDPEKVTVPLEDKKDTV